MSENKKTSVKNATPKAKKDTAWIVLGAICIMAALSLGVVNGITSPIISRLTEETAQKTRRAMLPQANTFNMVEGIDAVDSIWCGVDEAGNAVGYVGEITVTGFGGKVVVTVGMDLNKEITGVSVGGSDFSETAGLGAKAKGSATATEHNDFLDQFLTDEGKKAAKGYEVVKSGSAGTSDKNDIDAITSATKTSNAIVTGNVTGNDPDNGGINKLCAVICELIDQNIDSSVTPVPVEGQQNEGVTE